MPEGFLVLIRKEFASLAERYGFREVAHTDKPVLQRVLYLSETRAVRFYLDVRDGYLDATYGPSTLFDSAGVLAQPAVESAGALRSVLAVLRPEGIDWPERYGGLFEPGRLERAVSDLLAGMERHAELILGSAGA